MKNPMTDFDAILIAGPTAGGKSAMALQMAKKYNGVILNTDSMQVYNTLQVLTARPSRDEMDDIDHLLYGHVEATQFYSTGQWVRSVETLLPTIRAAGKIPVFVGGTGLYFKALTGGLSDMPDVPEDIRNQYRQRLLESGALALYEELQQLDPEIARKLNMSDGHRIVRALEILAATGKSISQYTSVGGPMVVNPLKAKKIVVLPDRQVLHKKINQRFETMLEYGAVSEVEAFLAQDPDPTCPAMKAIGVREIEQFLKGKLSRNDVISLASAATRQYAKRQMTWFRNQMGEDWVRVDPEKGILP